MADVERLTAGDVAMLAPEEFGWREDIGAVAILDGGALLDADGRVRLEVLCERVDARIHLVPRFRQLVRTLPPWFGGPIWVDAPSFSARDHLAVSVLPADADEAALLREVERLRRQPFPAGRPAWAMWLLPGLADGRVAFYIKVHHTIADGVAGVDQVARFLDLAADTPAGSPQPWTPRTWPSTRDLLIDRLRSWASLLATTASRLGHPVATARSLVAAIAFSRATLGQTPVSSTSLDHPIGDGRRTRFIHEDLDRVRAIAHHHRATVNDVLLTAVAGGYRDLLAARGELVDGLSMRASVPVSLHMKDGTAAGNEVSDIFVPLPVGQPDPSARLGVIAQSTAERKRHIAPLPGGPLMTNRYVLRAFWGRFGHQRWANAYTANIPGPPVPLFIAGARIESLFAVVPIIGNVPIGVGAISYAGQFNITVVVDEEAVPDVDVFVAAVRATLAELAGRVDGRR